MKKNSVLKFALVFCLPLIAVRAFCDPYAAISVGIADTESSSFDDSVAFKISAGYDFSKYLAVELSYVDLGEFEADADAINLSNDLLMLEGLLPQNVTVSAAGVEITGAELAVKGMLPLAKHFLLFARLGAFYWEGDASIDIDGLGAFWGSSSSLDEGVDVSYGVGVGFPINEKLSINLEFNRYDAVDTDNDMISIGLSSGF